MRRSYFSIAIIASAVILFTAIGASGQTGALRGSVKLIGPDGNAAPLLGAIIDVYRTDISGEYHTKTDKKGEWVFAGLPYVGTYVVSISAPGAAPNARSGVKAGREIPVDVVLNPGDGKKLTRDEAIAVSKGGGTTGSGSTSSGESAATKAKREEEAKKYEAEKTRVTNVNETLNRTFKAGREALNAKNYDEAIKQFDEGLAADQDQVVFYTLKSSALRSRGVDHYNASTKLKDEAKTAELDNAKKDFQASADVATKGVEVANKETPATDAAAQASQASKKLEIVGSRAESYRLLVKVDPSKIDAGLTAYQEYMAAETDAAKKTKAQKDMAQMLFDAASDANGFEKARAEYQKILDANLDDTDAMLRIGQALFNIGAFNNNDKGKYQEAANYLQRFVDKSPDGQLKTEAKELIEALKAQANVTPEKTSTPPRRKRP